MLVKETNTTWQFEPLNFLIFYLFVYRKDSSKKIFSVIVWKYRLMKYVMTSIDELVNEWEIMTWMSKQIKYHFSYLNMSNFMGTKLYCLIADETNVYSSESMTMGRQINEKIINVKHDQFFVCFFFFVFCFLIFCGRVFFCCCCCLFGVFSGEAEFRPEITLVRLRSILMSL